jgi:hypothetical protein
MKLKLRRGYAGDFIYVEIRGIEERERESFREDDTQESRGNWKRASGSGNADKKILLMVRREDE